MKNRGFTSGLLVCLVAAGTGLLFVLSLFLQEGLHVSARDTSLGLLPLTLGLVAAGFAAMGGLVAELGRRLVFIGSPSSIQQLASAIGSAAVASIFFQAATSGLDHAMRVSLIVVLAVTALSLPVVALMPRKAPSEPHQ
jgi:hypothetical protein